MPTGTVQLGSQRLRLRLWLPLCAMVLLFLILVFYVILPTFERELLTGKENAMQYLTETAWSVIADHYEMERSGLLTREEAQRAARDRLRAARYGLDGNNYFWIISGEGRTVMHPLRPDMEGRTSAEITDANLAFYVGMVHQRIGGKPEGFIDYDWLSPDNSSRGTPKRAYVKRFSPWDWHVGTSVYMEDVAAETDNLRNRLLTCLGTIFVIVTLLSGMTIRRNTYAEREREQAEGALRENEVRLRKILDTLQAGVVVVDADTHEILDVNPAALQMIGAERDTVLGHICHKFICPAAQGRCPITDLNLTVEKANKILLRADGSHMEIMKTVIPTDLNGRRVLLESFVDISAHVAAERELKRHVEQLSEAKARLEVLVANITGREKRMVELKQEVNDLLRDMGREPRYEAPEKVKRLLKAQAMLGHP